MALTKTRKAAAFGRRCHTGEKWIQWASSHRGAKKGKAKKIPDEIYDPADTSFRVECPAFSNKRNSKAVVDVFGLEYEDAHLAVSASTTLYLPACRIGCLA